MFIKNVFTNHFFIKLSGRIAFETVQLGRKRGGTVEVLLIRYEIHI